MSEENTGRKLSSKEKEMTNFLRQTCDLEDQNHGGRKQRSTSRSPKRRSGHIQSTSPTAARRSAEEALLDKISLDDIEILRMYLLRKYENQRKRPSPSRRANKSKPGSAVLDEINSHYEKNVLGGSGSGKEIPERSNTCFTESVTETNSNEEKDPQTPDNRYDKDIRVKRAEGDSFLIRTSASSSESNSNTPGPNSMDKENVEVKHPGLSLNTANDYSNDPEPDPCLSPTSMMNLSSLKQVLETSRPLTIMGKLNCNREAVVDDVFDDQIDIIEEEAQFVSKPRHAYKNELAPVRIGEELPQEFHRQVVSNSVDCKVSIADQSHSQSSKAASQSDRVPRTTRSIQSHTWNSFSTSGKNDEIAKLKNRIESAYISSDIDSLFNASKHCVYSLAKRIQYNQNRAKHLALISEEVRIFTRN